MPNWVCLSVNTSFHHGDKDSAASEIRRIFGDDLVEARIVCDDSIDASGEYFVFVLCENYHDHVDELIKSQAIARVVPSYHKPSYLSQNEVDDFAGSVDNNTGPVIYGDIVKVGDSDKEHPHLTGLTGIVIRLEGDRNSKHRVKNGYCDVFFRLCTLSFTETIFIDHLEILDNVFSRLKVKPFTNTVVRKSLFRSDMLERGRKAACSIVSGDKICRSKRRAHEATYHR